MPCLPLAKPEQDSNGESDYLLMGKVPALNTKIEAKWDNVALQVKEGVAQGGSISFAVSQVLFSSMS